MTAERFAQPQFLVDTAWLAARLEDPALVVLDGTTHLMPPPPSPYRVVAGRADFEAGHVPGAQFVTWTRSSPTPTRRRVCTSPCRRRNCLPPPWGAWAWAMTPSWCATPPPITGGPRGCGGC